MISVALLLFPGLGLALLGCKTVAEFTPVPPNDLLYITVRPFVRPRDMIRGLSSRFLGGNFYCAKIPYRHRNQVFICRQYCPTLMLPDLNNVPNLRSIFFNSLKISDDFF